MAKQPWQESKKKNNGDINREIKRAEIKREERAQAKVLEAKIKKTRQMGVMTLLVGFMLYLFSGSVTSAFSGVSVPSPSTISYSCTPSGTATS